MTRFWVVDDVGVADFAKVREIVVHVICIIHSLPFVQSAGSPPTNSLLIPFEIPVAEVLLTLPSASVTSMTLPRTSYFFSSSILVAVLLCANLRKA